MAVFGSHLIIENLYLYFYHLHLFPLNAFEYKKKTTGKLKKTKQLAVLEVFMIM